MTDEEIKEARRKARYICDGEFITFDVCNNFLKEHGYTLAGRNSGNIDWDRSYAKFFEFDENYDGAISGDLILIGNPEEWSDYIDDRWYCNNVVNNPFVKYMEIGKTTFKIYTIVENEDVKGDWIGPREEPWFCPKLEMDLSREWIKCLVRICPEFGEYQIQQCERYKKEAIEKRDRSENLINKKIAELLKEKEQLPNICDEKINKNNDIICVIQETLAENIDTIV